MKYTWLEADTLAKDLGIPLGTLYALSNDLGAHYHGVSLPKKDGGRRRLSVPDPFLKHVQRRIAKVILGTMPVSRHAMAYSAGDSPLGNALPHLQQKTILKLDIRQFFDHVTYPLVKEKVFREDRFSESNRILLSLLCTYDEALPQGAPTSPFISNILLHDFDEKIGSWCKDRKIVYTRYCDDLTFSGDLQEPDVKKLIAVVKAELRNYGLFINRRKSRLVHDGQRKKITGVIVNDQPNVPIAYRKKIRQEVYHIARHGIMEHLRHIACNDPPEKYLRSLLGRIGHVLAIRFSREFAGYKEIVLKELEKTMKDLV